MKQPQKSIKIELSNLLQTLCILYKAWTKSKDINIHEYYIERPIYNFVCDNMIRYGPIHIIRHDLTHVIRYDLVYVISKT